jgi:hypothetical protein
VVEASPAATGVMFLLEQFDKQVRAAMVIQVGDSSTGTVQWQYSGGRRGAIGDGRAAVAGQWQAGNSLPCDHAQPPCQCLCVDKLSSRLYCIHVPVGPCNCVSHSDAPPPLQKRPVHARIGPAVQQPCLHCNPTPHKQAIGSCRTLHHLINLPIECHPNLQRAFRAFKERRGGTLSPRPKQPGAAAAAGAKKEDKSGTRARCGDCCTVLSIPSKGDSPSTASYVRVRPYLVSDLGSMLERGHTDDGLT